VIVLWLHVRFDRQLRFFSIFLSGLNLLLVLQLARRCLSNAGDETNDDFFLYHPVQ